MSARLDRHGTIVAQATDAELDAIAATFAAAKVDAVTVMLLHAYANPEFEADVAAPLRRRLPGIAMTPRPRSGRNGASTSAAWWR